MDIRYNNAQIMLTAVKDRGFMKGNPGNRGYPRLVSG